MHSAALKKQHKIVICRIRRIIEWKGLEATLKIVWFQRPRHEQGHLPPAQSAQSSIQPGLEYCQGGAASLGSLGQGLTTLLNPDVLAARVKMAVLRLTSYVKAKALFPFFWV